MEAIEKSLYKDLPKIRETYSLVKMIGSGSFGEIFEAKRKDRKNHVAIKVEKRELVSRPTLRKEAHIMRLLLGMVGFPKIYKFTENSENSILIQKLLGENLETLFDICGYRFTLKTTLMVADQLLSRLEVLHDLGIVHRDIKPENMTIGITKTSFRTIHLIDFGLSKSFKENNSTHIPFINRRGLIGTVRYCSPNSHLGSELSRRDDLISLGYVLVYFFKGKLPWENIMISEKSLRYAKVHELKNLISPEELCKGMPSEFKTFMKYALSLSFFEAPNYVYLRDLFRKLFKRKGYVADLEYDWLSTCDIVRKYPKTIRNNLSSKPEEKLSEAVSHDYEKGKMAEGKKVTKKYPPITQLDNVENKPKLGSYLQKNKGGSLRSLRSIAEQRIKNGIFSKAKIRVNTLLEKQNNSAELRANSLGRPMVETMGLNITKINHYSGGAGSESKMEDLKSIEKSRDVSNSESQMVMKFRARNQSEEFLHPNQLKFQMKFETIKGFQSSFVFQLNQSTSNTGNGKATFSGNSINNIAPSCKNISPSMSQLNLQNAPSIQNMMKLMLAPVEDEEREEDLEEIDINEYESQHSIQNKMALLNSSSKIVKTKSAMASLQGIEKNRRLPI